MKLTEFNVDLAKVAAAYVLIRGLRRRTLTPKRLAVAQLLALSEVKLTWNPPPEDPVLAEFLRVRS